MQHEVDATAISTRTRSSFTINSLSLRVKKIFSKINLKSLVPFVFIFFSIRIAQGGEPDIILGQIASIKNPGISESSVELQRGYQIYFDKINAAGGVYGRKIRLIEKDDDYDARKTLALTRELIEKDGALALVGYQGTPGPLLISQEGLLKDNNIALIGPASGTALVQNMPNIFPVRATYESEIEEITKHAHSAMMKRVAMLTWTAGAGPVLAKAWPRMIREAGLELVENRTFDTSNDSNVLQHNIDVGLEPIVNAKPDAIFTIASGNALIALIAAIRTRLPSTTPIYVLSTANWKDVISRVGLKSAAGVIVSQCVPYPYSPVIPIIKNYQEDLKAAGNGSQPSYYSLEGYLGAVIAVEALRRAGPNPTRAKVLEALTHMGNTEIEGFGVYYTATVRKGFKTPDITMISTHGTLLR